MRIISINIPVENVELEIRNNGLAEIKMERLSNLVILAGKNGSGKSRILERIKDIFQRKPSQKFMERVDTDIAIHEDHNKSFQLEIDRLNNQLNSNQNITESQKLDRDIKNYTGYILSNQNTIISLKNQKSTHDLICTDIPMEQYRIIDFIPKSMELKDNYSISAQDLKKYSDLASNNLGIGQIADATLSRIQFLQNKWWNVTHQNSPASPEEREEATREYERLREIIKQFLHTDLNRNTEDQATLFGFRIGDSHLSEGQKIILQLCVAIHAQDGQISDSVIFMDEPENHLHPSIIIETIDTILSAIPTGQLWIATHSIPILAHFDTGCLHFVENGKLSYGGNIPEKVLESLLGTDDEKQKLLDFISMPETMVMNKFALECLLLPKSVETGRNDPQTNQINRIIQDLIAQKGKVRLLDYGAGKGRLLKNLIENHAAIDTIDYIAYDPCEESRKICIEVIENAYKTSKNKYFDSISTLRDTIDCEFDLIVLCNVLHEIDTCEWGSLFGRDGETTQLLNENGYLLLVEDTLLPLGEKPNSKGYLILNTNQIKDLFSCKIEELKIHSAQNDRLKAHLISKEVLNRYTSDTKKACLNNLYQTAVREIKKIRETEKPTMKEGRKHAFWTLQLANATLALGEI